MVNPESTPLSSALSSGLTIREAVVQDGAELLTLGRLLLAETDNFLRCPDERAAGVDTMQSIIAHYVQTPGWIMLNAWDGAVPVAEGVLSTGQLQRTAHVGTLGVGVLQEYWGRGIGQALIAALERQAAASYLDRLEFTVLSHNHRARRFYHRLGYREDGHRIGSVRYESDKLSGNVPIGHVQYADEIGMYKWIGVPLDATRDQGDAQE